MNMARAGIVARRALVEYNRAKLFPDIGLGAGADFVSTPSAVPQNNVWASDGWNHFYYYFGFGLQWSLDLLPQAARIEQAESQLEETRALERLALGNAMLEVEKAYADAVEAKAREETWDKAEHIAKQWISTVQDHIDLGTWDERSLLEPLRAYAGARGPAPLRAHGLQRVAQQPRARERLGQRGPDGGVSGGAPRSPPASLTRGRWRARASRGGAP